MGTVFDSYRVASNELKLPRWWLPVLDIIYWMAAAVMVFRVLYASNNGEVRAYVFIGLALGVIFYYFLLSKLVIVIVRWSIKAIRSLINFIVKCLYILIIKPVLLLYKLIILFLGFGSAFTILLFKIVIQLFRPFWRLLVWMGRPIARPVGRLLAPFVIKWQLGERFAKLGLILARFWSNWFRR
ncbi:Spore protein YabQ [compost metagenome]